MQATFSLFRADGRWPDLIAHGLRQIGLAVALPLAIYFLFQTPLSGVLMVAAVGVGLTALLTWGRVSWGRAIAFPPTGGVHIVRRDGSTREISADALLLRVKADCFVLMWLDGGKRRSLVVGREGFAPATWLQVRAAAQAQSQSQSQSQSQPAAPSMPA